MDGWKVKMSQLRRFLGKGLVWPELSIILALPMPRNTNTERFPPKFEQVLRSLRARVCRSVTKRARSKLTTWFSIYWDKTQNIQK